SPDAISTPSTTWLKSHAVAEAKFFKLVADYAPHDSFHLHCLHLCTRFLAGSYFSTYIMKTVLMHLLTAIPLSEWQKNYFPLRLGDIMGYLGYCVKEKRLNHFFFGSDKMPKMIILPQGFREAEPVNLFQHLVDDNAAHAQALRDFDKLKDKLASLL
ncbi:IPIL1 protein, partial [Urocolius indicus]|nr:IPIL1 protein [Urocolius indicus]